MGIEQGGEVKNENLETKGFQTLDMQPDVVSVGKYALNSVGDPDRHVRLCSLKREPLVHDEVLTGDLSRCVRQQEHEDPTQVVRRQQAFASTVCVLLGLKLVWLDVSNTARRQANCT